MGYIAQIGSNSDPHLTSGHTCIVLPYLQAVLLVVYAVFF